MKRIILPLILCAIFATYLYADLNPYAYGLSSSLSQDETTLTVNYSLNAPATAVSVVIMDGEEVVKSVNCTGITKGSYTVEVPTTDCPKKTALTWKVVVNGNSVGTPTLHNESIRFYLPYGMDVDVDPESDYMGNWYVIEATNGGQAKTGYQSNPFGRGLYAFDAALNPILNSAGTRGFLGGVIAGATETNINGDYVNFYRVATSGGRVFIGRFRAGDAYHPIVEANPADLNAAFTSVYTSGEAVSIDAIGHGEDLKIVMLTKDFNVQEFDLGTAKSIASPSRILSKTDVGIVRTDATIAYDNEGGVWFNQHRATATTTCATIAHLTANGVDYHNVKAELTHNNCSNSGIAVSPDGKQLAVVGAGTKKLTIYAISKDNTGKISLTKKHTISTAGDDHTALSYDYAGNLYVANRSAETITFYAMPYDGEVSTPCASKYAFELAEPVPHIMAYDLNVKQNGKYYDFSFYANTNATSGKLLFYDNTETLKGEVTIDQSITKGENTIKILTHEVPDGVDMTWKLQLTAPNNEAFGVIYASTDTLNRAHVAIDNSPESDYFGRIYIANRVSNGKGECYIYNYDYTPILSQSLCGMTKFQSASRPAVDAEGYVYWADYGDDHGGIWVMNPKTLTTTPFFDGTQDLATGLWKNSSGTYMGSSCSGAHIYSSGANTKLFAMNEDAADGLYEYGYNVYNIGQPNGTIQRTWNQEPSQAVEISDNMGQIFSIVGTSHGAWLCQNRCQNRNQAGAYSLMFYGNNGKRYFRSVDASLIDGSYGAGMAVSADESKLAMINGNNGIMLFDIEWNYNDSEGCEIPTITLHTTYRIPYQAISSMHFDYAGNLVTMAGTSYATYDQLSNTISEASDMRLVVFSTPTDNNTTTIPARTRLTVSNKITLLDTEDNTEVLEEHKNQTQNMSVFRSLTAGMYNTLCLPFDVNEFTGTPLENATVWQYNGATVENETTNKEIFLNFEEVTAIEAGKPYLVEPATDIAAPMEFKDVTISVTKGSNVAQSAVTMHGILHPKELQADVKSILFLVANNNLAWANVTANMKGMRAYFNVNDPSLLSARTRAYIRREPTMTTDMENITTTETEIKKVIYNNNLYILRGDEVYTIQGTNVK